MNIFTNRLKIHFNIDAIQQDFAFIQLERQQDNKYYRAKELDYLIGSDFKALSILFQQEKFAYAMFKKPINIYQLILNLRKDKNFENNAVIEVTPKIIDDNSNQCISEALLAQIFLNSLSSSRSRFPQYHFCNLTGSLLLVRDFKGKNKDYLDVAKITLSSDYLLEIKTVRFRTTISIKKEIKNTANSQRKKELSNALNKPEYRFEASTGSLRRHLPRDGKLDTKTTYVECGLTGKKASTPFLEFGNLESFYKSRAGIFNHVILSIHEHLSKYIKVHLLSREIEDTVELKNTLLKGSKQIHSKLDSQAIHIVDRVDDEESANLVTTLKKLLLPYITEEKLITIGKRDKQNALNFRIIHDAEFYKKREEKDEYLPSTNEFQRQHLTIESTQNVSDSIVKTLIKEQLIKRDISSRTLNLFNWKKLQLKGAWTFAAWDEEIRHVIFMEIQPNGNFEFYELDGQDILFNWQKFEKYREFMTDDSTDNKIRTLEGLVVSDAGDINQIFLTDEISIPDLSKIELILKEIETELPENKRNGQDLADIVEEFLQKEPELDNEKFESFSSELKNIGGQPISKKELKSLIAQYLGTTKKTGNKGEDKYISVSSTKEATHFRDYLLDHHQIRLKFPQDNQSKEDLFDASLNIKYFGITDKEAYYLVGDRRDQVQFSFKDACHLRKIVAVNSSQLIFRNLLPTMDVDFVRTGQSTVIPFPFKYIREYKTFGNDQ